MLLVNEICEHLSKRIKSGELTNEGLCNEVWEDVVGYEGLYKISNMGRVLSMIGRIEKILRPGLTNKGYLTVVLTKNRVAHNFKVHRLVSIAFIENTDNKPEVNHKNGVKSDNKLSNLEWATTKENVIHAFKNIKRNNVKGERCAKSKLTKEQVLEIRALGKTKTLKNISDLYGITPTSVCDILNRKNWKHI